MFNPLLEASREATNTGIKVGNDYIIVKGPCINICSTPV